MRISILNLGCKVNQYESTAIANDLRNYGFEVHTDLIAADVYVINTCAVTAEAERKSRQAVSRCLALNPQSQIYICGCASENNSESFKKNGVVYICGTKQKNTIVEKIVQNVSSKLSSTKNLKEQSTSVRSYVKIQDGCNNFCSYCIIPLLRGRSKSRKIDEIMSEIDVLSKNSSEIVLTGINLMSYGYDIGTNFTELIKALKDVDVRLRLGSIYAEKIEVEILDHLFSIKNFCPHFHLSLQSGDNKVLRDMNRLYSTELYKEKIELIRKYDKNACIVADVITGYPTETADNYQNTYNYLQQMRFSDIHVFPYSPRKGTPAALLKPLSQEDMRWRKSNLLDLKSKLHTDYLKQNLNREHDVLIEESKDGYSVGYSQYYIKIYTKKYSSGLVRCVPTAIYNNGLKEEL